jgi:hypothetical protein
MGTLKWIFEKRYSSVGIATATGWTVRESEFDSLQEKEIFVFSIAFRPALGPPSLLSNWYGDIYSNIMLKLSTGRNLNLYILFEN